MQKIAVINFDDFSRDFLERAADGDVAFESALSREETIIGPEGFPFEARLDLATEGGDPAEHGVRPRARSTATA